jgi:hypothetical protein
LSSFCGFSWIEDFWTRESGNPNLVSALPGLNSFDLVMGVGAEVPAYDSVCSFAANVARRLDRVVFETFACCSSSSV